MAQMPQDMDRLSRLPRLSSTTLANTVREVEDSTESFGPRLEGLYQEILHNLEESLKNGSWDKQHHGLVAKLDECLIKLKCWSHDIKDASITLPIVEAQSSEISSLTRGFFQDISAKLDDLILSASKTEEEQEPTIPIELANQLHNLVVQITSQVEAFRTVRDLHDQDGPVTLLQSLLQEEEQNLSKDLVDNDVMFKGEHLKNEHPFQTPDENQQKQQVPAPDKPTVELPSASQEQREKNDDSDKPSKDYSVWNWNKLDDSKEQTGLAEKVPEIFGCPNCDKQLSRESLSAIHYTLSHKQNGVDVRIECARCGEDLTPEELGSQQGKRFHPDKREQVEGSMMVDGSACETKKKEKEKDDDGDEWGGFITRKQPKSNKKGCEDDRGKETSTTDVGPEFDSKPWSFNKGQSFGLFANPDFQTSAFDFSLKKGEEEVKSKVPKVASLEDNLTSNTDQKKSLSGTDSQKQTPVGHNTDIKRPHFEPKTPSRLGKVFEVPRYPEDRKAPESKIPQSHKITISIPPKPSAESASDSETYSEDSIGVISSNNAESGSWIYIGGTGNLELEDSKGTQSRNSKSADPPRPKSPERYSRNIPRAQSGVSATSQRLRSPIRYSEEVRRAERMPKAQSGVSAASRLRSYYGTTIREEDIPKRTQSFSSRKVEKPDDSKPREPRRPSKTTSRADFDYDPIYPLYDKWGSYYISNDRNPFLIPPDPYDVFSGSQNPFVTPQNPFIMPDMTHDSFMPPQPAFYTPVESSDGFRKDWQDLFDETNEAVWTNVLNSYQIEQLRRVAHWECCRTNPQMVYMAPKAIDRRYIHYGAPAPPSTQEKNLAYWQNRRIKAIVAGTPGHVDYYPMSYPPAFNVHPWPYESAEDGDNDIRNSSDLLPRLEKLQKQLSELQESIRQDGSKQSNLPKPDIASLFAKQYGNNRSNRSTMESVRSTVDSGIGESVASGVGNARLLEAERKTTELEAELETLIRRLKPSGVRVV